jgi:Tfp pilus assembly protein PilX
MFKEVKTAKNEQGFASVVVALTLIIVLALLTVAFAQLARREQQNALDKQLAIQAYYAAETGVNDIVDHLKDFPYGTNANQCLDNSTLDTKIGVTSAGQHAKDVNNNTGVSYSCVLLDKKPFDLKIDDISPDQGQYSTFTASGVIKSMTIEWTSGDGVGTFVANQASTKFQPKANWSYPAVVQFTLTPINNLTRSNLINNSYTAYLYPESKTGPSPGPSVNYAPANSGQIVSGKCDINNAYNCSVTINNLDSLGSSKFLFHLVTYYDAKTNIRVTATDVNSNPVTVLDQASIDVTGKARNVVKRIQVRVRTNPTNGQAQPTPILPDYALEAQNICKRIWAAPVTGENPPGSQYKYPGSPPSPDPCNLSN